MWNVIIIDYSPLPNSVIRDCRMSSTIVNTFVMNLIVQGKTKDQSIEVIYLGE